MFPLTGLFLRVEEPERVQTHDLLLDGAEKVTDIEDCFRQIICTLRINCITSQSFFENTVANTLLRI